MTDDPATDTGDVPAMVGDDDGLPVRVADGSARPDRRLLPEAPVTRFAPAPTGFLHFGHLVNAAYTWGIARATGGRVILRVKDHDRQRCRPEFETALLEDLERLGLVPDEPSISVPGGTNALPAVVVGRRIRGRAGAARAGGLVYACACSRTTFAAYQAERGRPWRGVGCPGKIRHRRPPPRRKARACGWPWARARSAGSTSWRARWPTSPRRAATCWSAIGSGTGRTRSAWSWTTCGTASTWSSAAGTCCTRRPSSCGSPACWRGGRRPVPPPPAGPSRIGLEAVQGRRGHCRADPAGRRGHAGAERSS